MTESPARLDPTDVAFDITSEEVHAARARCWFAETPYGLAVLRHPEAGALLKDRRLRQGSAAWPAHNGITSGIFHDWWSGVLLSVEGDDHLRLRRLLNPAFSQRAISAMVPQFQALANELIDAFAETGRCEFVAQFAEPYSARIICRLLGFPEEEWKEISDHTVALGRSLGVTVADDLDTIEAGLAGLYGYCDAVIADRQQAPRDDFASVLVGAVDDGDRLSSEELRTALVFLVFAGMDTTRHQLGLAIQTFLDHPDQWDLLGADASLGPAAVEEVMRVNPTITWISRETLEPIQVNACPIAAGTTVQVFSHAAGTDPGVMPDPSFDITAERPPHYGFGAGLHHCLGHFVARSDMSVALALLAQRLRGLRADGPGEWLPRSGNTGPLRLPLTFTPQRPLDG